jgi:succinate dehydrogenase / fumarate reductase, flavoprotein subunit
LWVDYELMTTIPGLYAIGEANFSDHGANRLGASALMQGLADGYFVLPYTIQNYLSSEIRTPRMSTDLPEFISAEYEVKKRIEKLFDIKGKNSSDSFHKKLGHIMWEDVGMGRTKESLEKAIEQIKELNTDFRKNLRIPGTSSELNPEIEKALRISDFLELGKLIAIDALHRKESCGGHFREEYQTEEGEALRNDENFKYVAAWEYKGNNREPELNKEQLDYENIEVKQRNYK